jgi:hypothetical protein
MQRGGGHLAIVIEADIRHDGGPVSDERNQEADQGDDSFILGKNSEGMNALLFLKERFNWKSSRSGDAH